ncbi:response regulator [Pelagibius sp. Alg239-R121]|uniref:response regulator n=1 Tax=Pelagibius sp. Alg239-R121 TaxID=2993448 RepID=UPI0024A6A496|nr:response regulator transcription factor [Pelagibius sp. Alg239-R121]
MLQEPNIAEPHILVVDDRRDIRDPLRQFLQKQGMRVSLAASASEARKLLPDAAIDLIVLDIMMPGEDGLSLCRHIRTKSALPIILLTALADDTDRIVGLELGADDYLVKPFNPRELLARIRAVLRRSQIEQPAIVDSTANWQIGPWQFDAGAQLLRHENGADVSLSNGESKLLEVMVARAGRVLSRAQLLDLTQGREGGPFDRAIDNHISRLRKKIESPDNPDRVFQTVWGGGYKLVAEVKKR